MSVSLQPSSSLGFPRPLTQSVKRTLKISNNNVQPVAFKVKTTAPRLYCVRPNSGRVEPGQSVEVQVLLQAMKEEPPLAAKCKDKFLIQSTTIAPEKETLSLAHIWNTNNGETHSQKIKVTYLPPEGTSIPGEEASAPLDLVTFGSADDNSATISPAAAVPLSTIFCADDANVVIRAAGTFDFRAHKCILSLASPIFKDMFTVSQPPSDIPPHINVHEPAKTWENILRTIYPLLNPTIDNLDDLDSLLLAAKKYKIQIVIDSYKKSFESRGFIQQDPLHLYAIACACGFDDQAKYVARHAEHLTVAQRSDPDNFKGLTVEFYLRLVSFLAERDNEWFQILSKDLTSFGVCCPCDEGRKEAFYNGIKGNLKVWHLQAAEIYFNALEDPYRLRLDCSAAANCVFAASEIKSFIERRIREREMVCDKFIWR